MSQVGIESKSDINKLSSERMKEFTDVMLKIGAQRGIGAQDMADFFKKIATEGNLGPSTQSQDERNNRMASFLQLAATQEENLKKKQLGESRYLSSASPVLASSSLQQIGGGDISSVMSGLYTGTIEDNTRRTADATEKIANNLPSENTATN